MNDPFARLGLAMARLRWIVIAVWVVVLVVTGALFAPNTASVLQAGGFILEDSESGRAESILSERFGSSTANNVIALFQSPDTPIDDPALADEITAALERIREVEGVGTVVSFYDTADPTLISEDGRTTYAVIELLGTEGENQERVPELREQLEEVSVPHQITGLAAINHDLETVSEEDLRRAEVVTLPIVLILLLLVFRTVIAAAIPLIIGVAAVVTALSVMYGVGQQTAISIFALNVGSMIGLALGVDFSLITVSRFRDELKLGRSPESAIAVTMSTAGRTITYSAITTIASMAVLTALFGLMVVRSISLGVMLVAFTALLAGLTLLPAVLAALGHRVDALRIIPERKVQKELKDQFWYRLSHRIMRRPVIWLAVALAILAIASVPLKDLAIYGTTPRIIPPEVESAGGAIAMDENFGANRLTPIQLVIEAPREGDVWRPEFLEAYYTLSERAAADPRSAEVASLATLTGEGTTVEQFRQLTPESFTSDPADAAAASRFVNIEGGNDTAVITITSGFSQYTDEHEGLVRELRNEIIPGVAQLRVYDVSVGGDAARGMDYRDYLYGRFPYLVAGVLGLTFIVLMMFFQSIFLSIKAIFMNLVTILPTYGLLVLIFQYGLGAELLGFESMDRIGMFTLPVLFAILFGLSIDYEVFILSRVKEYYEETGDNDEAVARGLATTAGIITAAGLILIGTFGSFGIGDVLTIKEIGIGLAIGVFIDATIVRVIIVPATMKLSGSINWWMPEFLKKIVPELREGPAEFPDVVPAPAMAQVSGASQAPSISASSSTEMDRVARSSSSDARKAAQPKPERRIGRMHSKGGWIGTDVIDLYPGTTFHIGRDVSSNLQLFDMRISRHHARIEYRDGEFVVLDLNSTNGVYVNGTRISAPTVLQPGDQIEIGTMGTVKFEFELVPARAVSGSAVSS